MVFNLQYPRAFLDRLTSVAKHQIWCCFCILRNTHEELTEVSRSWVPLISLSACLMAFSAAFWAFSASSSAAFTMSAVTLTSVAPLLWSKAIVNALSAFTLGLEKEQVIHCKGPFLSLKEWESVSGQVKLCIFWYNGMKVLFKLQVTENS